jgi:hypothetical protein
MCVSISAFIGRTLRDSRTRLAGRSDGSPLGGEGQTRRYRCVAVTTNDSPHQSFCSTVGPCAAGRLSLHNQVKPSWWLATSPPVRRPTGRRRADHAGALSRARRRVRPARRTRGSSRPTRERSADTSCPPPNGAAASARSRPHGPGAAAPQWAELMRRTLGLDVLACARCGGRLGALTARNVDRMSQVSLSRRPPGRRPGKSNRD